MYQTHRELFGDPLWEKLCALAPPRHRKTKSVLLLQGAPGTHVLVLASGSVAVTRRDGSGQRTMLAVRGAGALLGELAVLAEERRSATVMAVEPCTVHIVPAPEFHAFIDEHRLLQVLMRHTVGQVRQSEEIRQELATASVPVRLVAALLRLAESTARPVRGPVRIKLSQDEIAQLIGCSRNSVVEALRPLRAHGLVQSFAGGLEVVDLVGLRAFRVTA
ncbi:Crp/Fnr family transcriptional regulator [Kitasatospora sp. NPDC057542]|uniref:Crp/Fnr family transcriptional regulator n=1 Tax=Streptomycetaceae TaxID=2062 RepID=UPI001CCF0644|nr:Crp/Fnr family transcriptional regulator [Streptomyces sp. LS1784]